MCRSWGKSLPEVRNGLDGLPPSLVTPYDIDEERAFLAMDAELRDWRAGQGTVQGSRSAPGR